MHRTAILTLALAALSGSSLSAFAQSAIQPPYLPQPAPIAAGVGYPASFQLQPQPQPQPGMQAAPLPPGMMAAPGMTGTQFMQGVAPPAAAIPIVPPGGYLAPVATQALPIAGSMPQYFQPLPTVALTNTYTTGNPYVTQQTQIYTPSYYYYYQGAPAQPQPAQMAPAMMGFMPMMGFDMNGGMGGGMGGMNASPFGSMSNARGEMGHVRYPYYSYRRPWYFPGQPSFNTTIDGPVW